MDGIVTGLCLLLEAASSRKNRGKKRQIGLDFWRRIGVAWYNNAVRETFAGLFEWLGTSPTPSFPR
jgi:hypothetical protein